MPLVRPELLVNPIGEKYVSLLWELPAAQQARRGEGGDKTPSSSHEISAD